MVDKILWLIDPIASIKFYYLDNNPGAISALLGGIDGYHQSAYVYSGMVNLSSVSVTP